MFFKKKTTTQDRKVTTSEGAAGPQGQVAEGQAGAEAPAGQRSSLESFEAEGASELELEVAACVAQLVWAESWGSTSHFIDDLGVDSAGFGKLITLLRRRPSLKCVDLPMLFEHPTVQGLARRIDERTREESEDGGCEDLEDWCGPSSSSEQDLVELFLASAKEWPHAVCCEELGTSTTYAQVQSQAIAIQLLLLRFAQGVFVVFVVVGFIVSCCCWPRSGLVLILRSVGVWVQICEQDFLHRGQISFFTVFFTYVTFVFASNYCAPVK
ncbi:unnamed protein product [Polarella glacialis]|uniref:Carrier domain-containing protein n=1 Tax=Polarella glacialis TaxID=89957 RepID=A0A813K0E7_POLGL|nr:unnamed protein product [Polarella glacialis]